METNVGPRTPNDDAAGDEEVEDGDDDISDKLVIDCDRARTPETVLPSTVSSDCNVQKSTKAEKASARCNKGLKALELSESKSKTSLGSKSSSSSSQLSPSMSFSFASEAKFSSAEEGNAVQENASSFDATEPSKAGNGLRMKIKMKKMATRQSAARHEVVSLDVDAGTSRGGEKRKTGSRKRVMNRSPSGTSFAACERSTLQRLKKPRRSTRCSNNRVSAISVPAENGQCNASEPGTAVVLEGVLWKETSDGILVVNVTWRGKSYVGTLLDLTQYNWSPPRQSESPVVEQNGSRGVGGGGGGGGGGRGGRCSRRGATTQRSMINNRANDGGTVSLNGKLPWSSESTKGRTESQNAAAITPEKEIDVDDHSVTASADGLPSAHNSLSDKSNQVADINALAEVKNSYVECKKDDDQQCASQEGHARRVTLADLARAAISLESNAKKAQPWSLSAKPFGKLSAEEAESLDNLFRVVSSGQSADSQSTAMGHSLQSDCSNVAGDGCSKGEEAPKPGPPESMRSLVGAEGPLDISDDESEVVANVEWKPPFPSVSTNAGNSYPLANGLFMNFMHGGLMMDPGIVGNGNTVIGGGTESFNGQVSLRNENPLNIAYPAPPFMNSDQSAPSTSVKGSSPIGSAAAHSINRLPPPAFVYEPFIPTYFGIPKAMFPYPAGCMFAHPQSAAHQQIFTDAGIIPPGYNLEYGRSSCLDAAGCSTAGSTGAASNEVLPTRRSVCTSTLAAATKSVPMDSCPVAGEAEENK
ncbi:hypothetical protein TTRE_0000575001 [Trichuris trichiura]|uniref:Uncharacterized protein n=1 Tax=Trichuris trichiura TaxID=36087 RepID=A0A077ZD30_TRITR|nr:hypothetical protein TTRE_0000575001 [Trichuris trichiura]